MITDSLNRNTNIKYDYRNLITQIQHKAIVDSDTSFYLTFYTYDEAGNRIVKTIYRYSSSGGPPENSSPGDPTTDDYWELYNVEIYSRDVSGREMAIYKNDTILEYPVYGPDMIGKIKDDAPYFYLKDHLGSVRAVLNSTGGLVSAQDYDAWGYLLENRNYESDSSKFKFTGKERDDESKYDYFGARYYDARVGRWGGIDPLFEKHISFTPYNYVLNDPLVLVDPNGKQVFVAFSGYGGLKAGKAINPSDYANQSIGTEVLLNDVANYSETNKLTDFQMQGYYASPLESEVQSAFNFILSNLNSNDKPIILYGLSMGGANINDLADLLINAGIENPITLFTVDAFNPFTYTEGLTISSKIDINYNLYQKKQESILGIGFGPRGFPNKSESNNVINIEVTNVDHYNIDEATNNSISSSIKSYMRRWRDR